MNKVVVIFDCSGSMAEMGHRAVIKNIFMSVRQHYPGIEMYSWNTTIQKITKAKEIITEGQITAKAWSDFFNDVEQDTKFLLVSDGCWSNQDTNDICAAIKGRCIFVCALGQEANFATLGKVRTIGKKVFKVADFPMVLEYLLRM